ncbi:MAG: ugpQ 2 [Pseudonocardiales bacterium]|nr:ugpQ 2 [Pseudonocardiales bacterium]
MEHPLRHDAGVPFLDAPKPIAFAHRGFAPDGCENSLAAFERAVGLGYRYLETDVRVTADGVALAFHDSSLDRVTDGRGKVSELPWAQVRQARIGGREPIPLLTDLIAAWPQTRVNLDVKAEHSIGPTIDAIRRTASVDRVCVGAFSTARINAVRRVFGARLCTSLGPREALALRFAASRHQRRRQLAGQCAQVPARIGRVPFVDQRYLDRAHGRGLQVHVWTVNDRLEMGRLLDLGVDGVMTDAADVLRDLLVARGEWHTSIGDP